MMFFPLTESIPKILTFSLALGSNSHGKGSRSGSSSSSSDIGWVDGLYRHACKGLSADCLEKVTLLQPGDTFPDDRVYALLKLNDKTTKGGSNSMGKEQQQQQQQLIFDPENPQWLHKENFLCAFSAPKFLAQFESKYNHETKRLCLFRRSLSSPILDMDDDNNTNKKNSNNKIPPPSELLLDSIDMSTISGRQILADFFSQESGIPVTCVTAMDHHRHHQFGNTSSGWKQKRDTRTIHIVNAATVRALSKAIGIPLNPTRFRPNIVIDGIPAWSEFDWVEKQPQQEQQQGGHVIQIGSTKLEVIARTVRCDGVSVDPLDMINVIDIPKCLIQHFPEHGPYLGVYAVVQQGGDISLGDTVASTSSGVMATPSPSRSETGPYSIHSAISKTMAPLPESRRSVLQQAILSATAVMNPMTPAFAEEDDSLSTATALTSGMVEVTPSSPESKKLFSEGRALESQGNMAAAQRLYAKVTKISPRFIYGWSNLGNTQVAMGDLIGADENYSQAISLCQESLQNQSSKDGGKKCNDLYLLFLNRGSVRLNTDGMAQEALTDLQQADALRQRPDALILQNLARAKELNGMYAAADRDYTISISMTANEVNPFWLRSAMVKLQLGDIKAGVDLLKRVENRFPEAPEVRAASATFLAQQGQQVEAQRKYLEIPDRPRQRFADDTYLQKVLVWPPAMIDGITRIAKAVGDR